MLHKYNTSQIEVHQMVYMPILSLIQYFGRITSLQEDLENCDTPYQQ